MAIGGFGLSALDAMSCLTVGRGGRFDRSGGTLRYLPSGAEPRLLFYSRSGRACRARPRILRYGPPYRPLLFTPGIGIDRLRRRDDRVARWTSSGRCGRWCWTSCGSPTGVPRPGRPARPRPAQLERRLLDAAAGGGLTRLLDALDAEHGRFDPELLLDGSQPMSLTDAAGYQGWLAAELAADLAEGELGLQGSIVKQTLDILRELRDTFRHAVDFGGLTPDQPPVLPADRAGAQPRSRRPTVRTA